MRSAQREAAISSLRYQVKSTAGAFSTADAAERTAKTVFDGPFDAAVSAAAALLTEPPSASGERP